MMCRASTLDAPTQFFKPIQQDIQLKEIHTWTQKKKTRATVREGPGLDSQIRSVHARISPLLSKILFETFL
jgi:hypothetical protein